MEDQNELQLLPIPFSTASSSRDTLFNIRSGVSDQSAGPLDLQLSISLRPILSASDSEHGDVKHDKSYVDALKWQTAEQIRLAATEKAYAERVRELTRREMELAQSEFERASKLWQRTRENIEKAEMMKERATQQVDSMCMEITCQSCRQRFRP